LFHSDQESDGPGSFKMPAEKKDLLSASSTKRRGAVKSKLERYNDCTAVGGHKRGYWCRLLWRGLPARGVSFSSWARCPRDDLRKRAATQRQTPRRGRGVL